MAKMKDKIVFTVIFKGHEQISPYWAAVYNCDSLDEMNAWINKHKHRIKHYAHTLPGAFNTLQELINFKGWCRGTLDLENPFVPANDDEAMYYCDIELDMKHYEVRDND